MIAVALAIGLLGLTANAAWCEIDAMRLPSGVKAVWDLGKAYRESTPTRQRVSINGLWMWRPAGENEIRVPEGGWGYFKVPGPWPGFDEFMLHDSQIVYAHPDWAKQDMRAVRAAWYRREVDVPAAWAGGKIVLQIEYLNSYADVFVDGTKAGEINFPGGELDLSERCRPGSRHTISLFVVAMPLKGVMTAYRDSASAKTVEGEVRRRGLCGDVWLESRPAGPRIDSAGVATSVSNRRIEFVADLAELDPRGRYVLKAQVKRGSKVIKEFAGPEFSGNEAAGGRYSFSDKWKPADLWDVDAPGNFYHYGLTLAGAGGEVLDESYPVRFGFREFEIRGRDFYLNGRRIFLSVVPIDNAQIGAGMANCSALHETMRRLQAFGFNAVYTHNYGCEPGSHISFSDVLCAADDVGMLLFFSQPHFGHYEWDAEDAEKSNNYGRHAEFYVRAARNHPAVVAYSMSHNACGYSEDMNPDLMDGSRAPRDKWAARNAERAIRAEAIVRKLDPSRIVYHHASGNMGVMHTSNFYANFVPRQEMSDWFGTWATKGDKPLFLCEYGVPLSWDWAMYRGWYKDEREFGSATVPWEFCQAEWSAQFLGDRAFKLTEAEKTNLRWEAEKFRQGKLWYRWDYPHRLGASDFPDRQAVFAEYFTDNLRAFRTWGVSAFCVWDHGHYWVPRAGVDRGRREFKTDWTDLQRPGFSPDYELGRMEKFETAFEREDWEPTVAGKALLRNNGPLLAYISGGRKGFTGKEHNYRPGERFEKQVVVINNSRHSVSAVVSWRFGLPKPAVGKGRMRVKAGDRALMPIKAALPRGIAPGTYALSASVDFGGGEIQEDSFAIHVIPNPARISSRARIAIMDPAGHTGRMLKGLGVAAAPVKAEADLAAYDFTVIGREALGLEGPGLDLERIRAGMKVVVFEQKPEVLEKLLGFRVTEYGLRKTFPRMRNHPVLDGVPDEALSDWRGEATLLPGRLEYKRDPRRGPVVNWCGIELPRAWRCGNRGNVASVLIEKPAAGDFLPILDGGFGLQYSPLFEYRLGSGMVLFCQLDVSGRTQDDPAALSLVRNLLEYAEGWRPPRRRKAVYLGEKAGIEHLRRAGVVLDEYGGRETASDRILILGPGGEGELQGGASEVKAWLAGGGKILAVGLDSAGTLASTGVKFRKEEYISAFFEPFESGSALAGVGPADVHNRAPAELALVSEGAEETAGAVASAANGNVVICQLVPWRFEYQNNYGLKRTFRSSSRLLARLLGNMGAEFAISTPPASLYLDSPEEWDDPYRFFRW